MDIMSKAVIHIMPGIDPSFHDSTNPICNPQNNPEEIAYQFLVPQDGTSAVADALKIMMKREKFDLALNIAGGGMYVR